MEAVREWAVALCAAAVLCAGAQIITPDEKKGKWMRIVFASVMLCAMVLPLARISGCRLSYDSNISDYSPDRRLCEAIEEQTASAVSSTVCRLVEDCLLGYDVEAEDISVSMDISDDGCISIGQITVRTAYPAGKSPEDIADYLYSRLGLKAEVITVEESE